MPFDRLDSQEQPRRFAQLCSELRYRLLAGESCRAEEFLSRDPALADDSAQALELIRTEWQARRERGEELTLEEYYRRFPQWREQLRRSLIPSSASSSNLDDIPTVHEQEIRTDDLGITSVQPLLDHLLQEKIGHGGMGIVYRGYDRVLKRQVAIKMIRSGLLATDDVIRRFYREAQTAAQLHHPHIVTIHGMGLLHGEHCFTMTLAEGGSLAQAGERFREQPRQAVELMEKVADALALAHERGIVHRDLKPANILLDDAGHPLVSDFGLAKLLESQAEWTLQGQILGTPAYMAPEQALGQTAQVGPGSDVWALGVILYELLAGQRPFLAESSQAVLDLVLTGEPEALPHLNPRIDRDLEYVVMKCLRKESQDRYPHAGELRDDLRRWLRGEPIRPDGFRWRRRLRVFRPTRHMVLPAAGCLVAVLAIAWADPLALFRPPSPQAVSASQQPRPLIFPNTITRGTGTLLPREDGSVLLETDGEAMVDLTEAPPWSRYRVQMEIEDCGNNTYEVGLYYDYHERSAQLFDSCWYGAWVFSERIYQRASRQGDQVRAAWTTLAYRRDSMIHNKKPPRTKGQRGVIPLFFSSRSRPSHHLALEVTPDAVYAIWDDEPRECMTMHWTQIQGHVAGMLATNPPLKEVVPRLGTGRIGVLCRNGAGIFRNARIEPLPDDR